MFGRIFRKKSFERDLDEELEAHLEIETRLQMERGLSPEAADAQGSTDVREPNSNCRVDKGGLGMGAA
ncbi:MAG TPA: permease prefix domain 1-containing protein [Bryobacteraceae bacterium]|jgi:hypothetical protein